MKNKITPEEQEKVHRVINDLLAVMEKNFPDDTADNHRLSMITVWSLTATVMKNLIRPEYWREAIKDAAVSIYESVEAERASSKSKK